MPFNRYFLDAPLLAGEKVALTEGEFHHLTHVMRQKAGAPVEIVNGRNLLATAYVEAIERNRAILSIRHVEEKISSRKKVILVQAIPRLSHLEWIVEKGTELNAEAFWLFPSLLSEKKEFSLAQEQRLAHLVIAAMKQCGRLDLPKMHYLPPLAEWETIPEGTLFFGDTREEAPLLKHETKQDPVFIFIGPEKGFHPKELLLLEERFRAKGVKLHDNILRVETAALVALATLSI
jgi:16S rRNA (uracil1498-N3)-methyltransferase